MANGLADRMRASTRSLHAEAERSGIVAQMIAGTIDCAGYRLYLLNLLPVYRSLEAALERCRDRPAVAAIFRPELARSGALEADIQALGGGTAHEPVILSASGRLSSRIEAIGRAGDGEALIAHAYTRYLGDLNGGQLLARRMQQTLGLGPDALNFFRFPAEVVAAGLARDYRAAIDRAGELAGDPDGIVIEAVTAFALNIEMSREAEAAVIQHRARVVGGNAPIDGE